MEILKNCNFAIEGDVMCKGVSLLIEEMIVHAKIFNSENLEQLFKVLKVIKINALLLYHDMIEEVALNIIKKIRMIQPGIKISICTACTFCS